MHPEFETSLAGTDTDGLLHHLQTNASLVTGIEKLFQEYPPRACKITLYGSNDHVYADVCQVKEGFTRATQGFRC